MPIISRVGRRSWAGRSLLTSIYVVLLLGAATMVFPLLVMVSQSVRSEVDFSAASLWPSFLTDDTVLWQRYVESKYGTIAEAEIAYRRPIQGWRSVPVPRPDPTEVAAFQDFRSHFAMPDTWYALGHCEHSRFLGKNARRYRQVLQEWYGGDIKAYSRDRGATLTSWWQVHPVLSGTSQYTTRLVGADLPPGTDQFNRFKAASPREDRIIVDLDGVYWHDYLWALWPDIDSYNRAHGTAWSDYRQLVLSERPPPPGPQRNDWEQFVRSSLHPQFIRVSATALSGWQRFLQARYEASIQRLNRAWRAAYADFADVALLDGSKLNANTWVDWADFLRDPLACPLDLLSIHGPRQAFEQYLADKAGNAPLRDPPHLLPTESTDHADFLAHRRALRREFLWRNYVHVLDYILINSHGVRNTVIYCGLTVLAALVINPLAAYALSRFRPPGTYKILLFCMATMTFPAEVTMIPSFLLLRQFPAWHVIVALAACGVLIWIVGRARPNWTLGTRIVLSLVGGAVAAIWLLPLLSHLFPHVNPAGVSLLNTFWALVLPGAANGFSIFLLKGFFDSLPRELYEAADIDGASEWTKFWTFTISLSKPILAVMALGAFTAAYSEYMMAFVIIPDDRMWTISVWLTQLQVNSHGSVIYASLVLAAIPTLSMFLLCQRFIMRGIIVPTEK